MNETLEHPLSFEDICEEYRKAIETLSQMMIAEFCLIDNIKITSRLEKKDRGVFDPEGKLRLSKSLKARERRASQQTNTVNALRERHNASVAIINQFIQHPRVVLTPHQVSQLKFLEQILNEIKKNKDTETDIR